MKKDHHNKCESKTAALKRLVTWLTIVSLLVQPALGAAEIVADPNAGSARPVVDTTANGLPLVQITNPSPAGVSRNQYTTFNVDPQGAILNNSTSVTLTQQAGYVDANPYLVTGPARVILNEVTGTGASSLLGYTEVAGRRAEVVIANPNGITCNGCGFINTSRSVLTTGTPLFGGTGSLDAFSVTGGNISVEGTGMNASNIDQVDLISRTVNINAGLWANYLNVITGSNEVSYVGLSTRPVTSDVPAPSVSLDVAALGGMYANKIRLVGTEKGVGVVNNGAIASAGDFSLTSEGNIVLSGQTSALGSLNIRTGGDLSLLSSGDSNNPNTLYSRAGMEITAGGELANNDLILADHLTVTANRLVNDGPSAVIATSNDTGTANFFIRDSLENKNEAAIYSMGDIVIAADGARDESGKYINWTGSLLNESARIEAGKDIIISAATVSNKKAVFATEEKIVSVEQKTENIAPPPGYVSATRTYTQTETLTQIAVNDIGENINSAPALLLAGHDSKITAHGLINEYSTIAAGNNLVIDASTELKNIARTGWRIVTIQNGNDVLGRTERFCRDRDMGVCIRWGDRIVYDTVPYSDTQIETQIPFPEGVATIVAGNHLSINAREIKNVTEGPGDASTTVTTIPNDKSKLPDFSISLPQNGLYRIQPDPGHPYLIETNPLFTNLKTFMSSDYMLDRLAYNPETTQKRLGDGFYEQQLVRDQILDTTGRMYLDGYSSNEEQFKALMDAGIAYAQAFDLKVGVGLTEEQMAQLTTDMVWLVEKEVQGQKVLVPVVYLSQLRENDLRPNGALIAANDISLHTADDLFNSGTIKAGNRNAIMGVNIINQGGRIDAGGLLALAAIQDIVNRSGTLAGGMIALDAGRDIRSETIVETVNMSPPSNAASSASSEQGGEKAARSFIKKAEGTSSDKSEYTYTRVGSQAAIESRGDLVATAGRDITLAGSNLTAQGDAALQAGRDLTVKSVEEKERVAVVFAGGGFYERDDTTNITSAIMVGGNLTMTAKNNATLQGAAVGAGGDLDLLAGGNVEITAVKDRAILDVKAGGGDNYIRTRTDDEYAIGSDLWAGGNITIAAIPWTSLGDDNDRGNILIEGSSIASQYGAVTLAADKDVTIKEAKEHHESLTETKTKTKHAFSSKTVETRDYVVQDLAVGSQVLGNAVTIASNKDLTVKGSAVIGAGDVALTAGNNIDITTAEQAIHEEHMRKEKRSGVSTSFGKGGAGISIGTNKQKSNTEIDAVYNVGSVVGSMSGAVSITAGKDATITGSEVTSDTGTDITGRNVTIDSAYDTLDTHSTFESKSSGLNIKLESELIKNVGKAHDAETRSDQVQDSRLKGLYAYQAGRALYDAYKALDAANMNPTADLKLSVGYGTSRSKSESESHSSTAVGSRLSSNGTLTITATGDGAEDGDLAVIGSSLEGKNISLDAARDITLKSAENTFDSKSTSKSSSGGAGVSAGVGGQGGGVSVYAEGSRSRGNTEEHSVTHTETLITAAENLSIKSGRDTTLRGAQAKADTIVANVGRDLNLESEQDTETYHAENKSVSGSLSVPIGAGTAGGSFSYTQGKTESTYYSVVEQTGLFAGSGGFDIYVGKNTDLKGAVIASTSPAENNRLSTESLTWSDIENKAEYSASTTGVSLSYDGKSKGIAGTGMSGVPIVGVSSSGDDRSSTLAAISPATIQIRSNPEQDLTELSRDPEKAHEALGKIFDKKKVEEQQELARVFGEEAFRLVGDIAYSFTKDYQEAQLQYDAARLAAQKAAAENDSEALSNAEAAMADAQAAMDVHRADYEMWKDGSAVKTALHTLVGGIQANFGGGNTFAGALGAGLNEATIPLIAEMSKGLTEKERQMLHQWASVVIGTAADKIAGADATAGAATALSGTVNNYLRHDQILKLNEELKKCLARQCSEEEQREIWMKWKAVADIQQELFFDECLNGVQEICGAMPWLMLGRGDLDASKIDADSPVAKEAAAYLHQQNRDIAIIGGTNFGAQVFDSRPGSAQEQGIEKIAGSLVGWLLTSLTDAESAKPPQPGVVQQGEPQPFTYIELDGKKYPVYTHGDAAKLPPGSGMIFVLEGPDQRTRPSNMSPSQQFDAATEGAMSDINTGKRIVPALRYNNTVTEGQHVVRFDGRSLDGGNELIDAKYNTDSMSAQRKSTVDAQRQAKALKDNSDFSLSWELPTTQRANSANEKLKRNTIGNIKAKGR